MSEAGNIFQADYIDRLPPEATLGHAFGDLFARSQVLVQRLEGRTSSTVISDTTKTSIDLVVGYSGYVGESELEDNQDGIAYGRTHISVGRTPIYSSVRDRRELLRLTHEGKAGEEASPGDIPIQVEVFRNYPSPWAAYSMRRHGQEAVFNISKLPIIDPPEEHERLYGHEEPYKGETVEDADKPIRQMAAEDRQRLRLVTNAIELGIVRTELLAQGADFHEMFGIEPQKQPRRVRSLSLGHLSLSWH